MSWVVYAYVLEHSRAQGATEQAVLLNLAQHAGQTHDGRDAYPSVARIASETKLDRRTVGRALGRLRDKRGAIRDDGLSPVGTRNYTVITDRTPEASGTAGDPRRSAAPGGAPPPAERPNPPAERPITPGGEPPEPSMTLHSKAESARARAITAPTLEDVLAVLRDPRVPTGRLRINERAIARSLTAFPQLADQHVLAAHETVMTAQSEFPNGTRTRQIDAAALLEQLLRRRHADTQLNLFRESGGPP